MVRVVRMVGVGLWESDCGRDWLWGRWRRLCTVGTFGGWAHVLARVYQSPPPSPAQARKLGVKLAGPQLLVTRLLAMLVVLRYLSTATGELMPP